MDPRDCLPRTLDDYLELERLMKTMSQRDAAHLLRVLCRNDTYALLRYVLSTRHWKNPEDKDLPFEFQRSLWDDQYWIDFCRMIQFMEPDTLVIAARYHGKSTVRMAEDIRQMLLNPNITIGIFSVTKQVADKFVFQLQHEIEQNVMLRGLFPDVFHDDPKRQSPLWTTEKGFIVNRPLVFKDPTVIGYGLLDSVFTGARISRAVYDDASNESNVTTPEMVEKTIKKWELSLNVGFPATKRYYVGTFYGHGDLYHHMVGQGIKLMLIPCFAIDEENSTFDDHGLPLKMEYHYDKPVLYSGEYLMYQKKIMRDTFGEQMLCWPQAGLKSGFRYEWLRFFEAPPSKVRPACNVVILVDPAGSKKKESCNSAMWVVGLGRDRNFYVLDGVIKRMNLQERTAILFDLVERWKPIEVRYEKYSMQADIEHISYVMEMRNYRFNIVEVGGNLAKDDRIDRLIPHFEASRIWMPKSLVVLVDGESRDLIKWFIDNEYRHHPNGQLKDGLDCLSRLCEPELTLPWPGQIAAANQDVWRQLLHKPQVAQASSGTWLSQ